MTESADKRTSTREVDGQQFYDYDVLGPVRSTRNAVHVLCALLYAHVQEGSLSPILVFKNEVDGGV